MRLRKFLWIGSLCTVVFAAVSCSSLSYYWQAVRGQIEISTKQEPISRVLARDSLDSTTRERLTRVVQIREFAVTHLALPDNGGYRQYADLHRRYVLWNVFATPEFSNALVQSCFPIAGCVDYRGFFSETAATEYAAQLHAQGHDTYVGGVPAYSTLGWFDDPVLNTFIDFPEAELARLLFHELAHQVVYVKDDSMFNESFATTVEEVGAARWAAARNSPGIAEDLRRGSERRTAFRALVARYRAELTALYEGGGDDATRRTRKHEIFAALKSDYRALVESWGESPNRSAWLKDDLNNAHLASVATYTELVPAFRALLDARHGDLPAFYADVKTLARLDKAQRLTELQRLQTQSALTTR